MKRLLLLRHAKSSWNDRSVDDFERPLNARGRAAAAAMGRYLLAEGLMPERVLCSSAVRARETWDRLLPHLAPAGDLPPGAAGRAPELELYRCLYLAAPAPLLEMLRRQPADCESLLLIAHNPGLGNLVARLAGPGSDREGLARAAEKFPTAALAVFGLEGADWSGLRPGGARLLRLVTPAELPLAP